MDAFSDSEGALGVISLALEVLEQHATQNRIPFFLSLFPSFSSFSHIRGCGIIRPAPDFF